MAKFHLTIEADSLADLRTQMQQFLNSLQPAASNSQPAPAAQPTLSNGQPDPAWCAIHNISMKRREKEGQVWHSHKADDGTWCKGKAKNNG